MYATCISITDNALQQEGYQSRQNGKWQIVVIESNCAEKQ